MHKAERVPRSIAPLVSLAAAVAFVFASPPVGDLWAARARAYASLHGVGLRYWFSWFDGTVPGHYSVLAPYLVRVANVSVLGAVATAASVLVCRRLLRGAEHATPALWVAAIGSGFSLWSGRVPFAVGTACALGCFLAIRSQRRGLAVVAGVACALSSPVAGAFLIIGLFGVWWHDRGRRAVCLSTAAATGLSLLGLALYFGLPGPEGFPAFSALIIAASLGAMLLARPAPYVRAVILLSLAALPVLVFAPNGMGTNFERFAWIWLPVATVATARARPPVALLAVGVAVCSSIAQTGHDLSVAAQPMSSPTYYTGLARELDHIADLPNYRVEVVPDGTHAAAYALLGHASLARGYETQSDNAFNATLSSPTLDATEFKLWLDNNAVGYVALDRATLEHGPEDTLVRSGGLPYLSRVWNDSDWQLFRVTDPSPVVAPPARVIDADMANLVIRVPHAATVALRTRWSRFLHVRGPRGVGTAAKVSPDGSGWTTLSVPAGGDYVVTG